MIAQSRYWMESKAQKLHAQITFAPETKQLHLQVPIENAYGRQMLLEGEDPAATVENRSENSTFLLRISPSVWADGNTGRAKNSEPVKIRRRRGLQLPGKDSTLSRRKS